MVHRGTSKQLSLVVVAGSGPSLVDRDWLKHITLDWTRLNVVRSFVRSSHFNSYQDVLAAHAGAFADELGHLKDTSAQLMVDSSCQPKFCKARPVHCERRNWIDKELSSQSLTQIGPLP